MPTRVEAYSATNATAKPHTRKPTNRQGPRSRAAATANAARNTKTYGRRASVPSKRWPKERREGTIGRGARGHPIKPTDLFQERGQRRAIVVIVSSDLFDGGQTERDMTSTTAVIAPIDAVIERAQAALLAAQEPDGHWVGEL